MLKNCIIYYLITKMTTCIKAKPKKKDDQTNIDKYIQGESKKLVLVF